RPGGAERLRLRRPFEGGQGRGNRRARRHRHPPRLPPAVEGGTASRQRAGGAGQPLPQLPRPPPRIRRPAGGSGGNRLRPRPPAALVLRSPAGGGRVLGPRSRLTRSRLTEVSG